MNKLQKELADAYLDYFNSCTAADRIGSSYSMPKLSSFAERFGISLKVAINVIDAGREIYEDTRKVQS